MCYQLSPFLKNSKMPASGEGYGIFTMGFLRRPCSILGYQYETPAALCILCIDLHFTLGVGCVPMPPKLYNNIGAPLIVNYRHHKSILLCCGLSNTKHAVIKRNPAMAAAFSKAILVTFVGSITPD